MKSKLFSLLLLLLMACQIPGIVPGIIVTATATLTATSTATPTSTPTSTETATPSPTATFTPTPLPHASRVLILSIDGLRPDAISLAPMPNLLALMQTSAYSLSAQTVFPSVTLVSHASMLVGVCPSKHGVDWNDYIPENGIAQGTDLFDIAHANGLRTVMFVGKEKLQQLTDASSIDQFVFINDRDLVITDSLIAQFPEDFGVLFIHFPTTDWMGHKYGWLSPEQFSVIRRADEALGKILGALDARGLRAETLIIISADHGGHDTSHGTRRPEDMMIPWVASGPGIQPTQLHTQVYTMDTAATAAYMLGLPIPPEWDGQPVYEAFGLPGRQGSAACQ
jgi:hypothetical protein